MSSREDTPEPGTSAADTNQAAPAAPQDENRENSVCPECRDISTACSSSCRHCFCQLCLWDWSLGEATCPRCGRLTRHPYPQRLALYHEVQDRVYDSKRRWRGHSAGPPRSPSGQPGHGRPCDRRRRRRSLRGPRDGRRRSQRTRGSDSPRRRAWWQQQRRVWEDTPDEGRRPNLDWAIPASSRGNQSRRGSSRSRRERSRGHRRRSRAREHSQGRDRRQSGSSWGDQDAQPGSRDHPSRHRRWRSWDADDRHTPRPQDDAPSESSETERGEESDSSGRRHARRRPSRGRSHGRGQNSQGTAPRDHSTEQRRWRSWDAEDRHPPGPQRDIPSRRSERHQWEDRDSSRQQRATRSRTQGTSHRRSQNSPTASQVPHNHSTRQRRSSNNDQGQAPRSQRDSPSSSGRSRSRAEHRDT